MDGLDKLRHLVQTQPIIDHHANHLLSHESALANLECSDLPLATIVSRALKQDLTNDQYNLPCRRAIVQLGSLYDKPCRTWHDVLDSQKEWVREHYIDLIQKSLKGTHVLFLDDSIGNHEDIEPFSNYDDFVAYPTKRIVQIEALAEAQILEIVRSERNPNEKIWNTFRQRFQKALEDAMEDSNIVAFKTVVLQRSGLDVEAYPSDDITLNGSLLRILDTGTIRSGFRVEDKPLCDWLVQQTLHHITFQKRAGVVKPLQIDMGPGIELQDNHASLLRSNPALLEPLISRYRQADIVLLHSVYPYTREASCLAASYPHLYLDLGGVFTTISREGQGKALRECLAVAPVKRLLWSTGGRFHPESFWLPTLQFRQALEKVLVDYVQQGDIHAEDACELAADILFNNSNVLYSLGLERPEPNQSAV